MRDSTSITEYAYNPYMYGSAWSGNTYMDGISTFNTLDAPATTSALTYKVQFRIYTTNNILTVCNYSAPASITLMEIAQ
jgi:hypothetical protein